MSAATQFWLLLVSFLGVLLLATKPLGIYIADVMEGRPNFAVRAGARLEGFLYKICAIDVREEMSWHQYAIALLLFNVLGAVELAAGRPDDARARHAAALALAAEIGDRPEQARAHRGLARATAQARTQPDGTLAAT